MADNGENSNDGQGKIPSFGDQFGAAMGVKPGDQKEFFEKDEDEDEGDGNGGDGSGDGDGNGGEGQGESGDGEGSGDGSGDQSGEGDGNGGDGSGDGDGNGGEGQGESGDVEGSGDGDGSGGGSDQNDYSLNTFRSIKGNDFETPEALVVAYNELKSKDPLEGYPYLQQLKKLAEDGHEINPQFISAISVDYKSMDPNKLDDALKLLRANYKIKNDTLTDSDIELLLEDKMFDESKRRLELERQYDKEADAEKIQQILDTEKNKHNQRLSIEAKTAHKELSVYQDKLVAPKRASDSDLQEQKENYERGVSDFMNGFDKISTKLGDDVVDMKLDVDTTNNIKKDLLLFGSNSAEFWKKHGGIKGLANMLAMKYAGSSLNGELQKRVASSTKEQLVKEMKNQSAHKDGDGGGDAQPTTITGAIAKGISEGNKS